MTYPRWHLAYTNPRQEVRVAMDIRARGMDAYLPMETRRVYPQGIARDAEVPLFPRYVFLGLSDGQRLDAIDGRGVEVVYGLVRILRKPTMEPVLVPSKVVADLQFAETAGLFDLRPRAIHYRPGDRVKHIAGPLTDRIGRIIAADPGERIRMLVEGFGGQFVVEADPGDIRPARDTDQPNP